MLKSRNLSNEYWAKVVACAIDVINKSPTKIMMKKVLEQAWSNMSYSVSHLGVFGCLAYAHAHKERRSKLDVKSEHCIFTSYGEQLKAYKLYNPVTKKTIIRRDVVFKEYESWNGIVDKTFDAQVPLVEEDDVAEKEHSKFALLSFQPSSLEEAIKDENWVKAIDEEIEAIEKNNTWDLVDLPKDKNLIGVKWVYKTKLNEKGEIDRFKAGLVAKGFS
eukprot:PITA_25218